MPIDKDISSHHFLSNPPKVCEWVCQGGGDGEGAEEDVGDSEVDQEDVARCPHHLSHRRNLMHINFNIIHHTVMSNNLWKDLIIDERKKDGDVGEEADLNHYLFFLGRSRERLKEKHQNADVMVKEERVRSRVRRRDKKRMTEIGKWMQLIRSGTMNMKNREDKEKIGEEKLE